jgi:hypothetical protein
METLVMSESTETEAHLRALSQLVLNPNKSAEAVHHIARLNRTGRDELLSLADAHHVVIRAFQTLEQSTVEAVHGRLIELAKSVLERERNRIAKALAALQRVCAELNAAGCPVAVMKTLDHWPDFGNDLDLITTGDERCVVHVLQDVLQASSLTRTIGDRLAHKRSFALPGVQEQVEMHVKRLGQAGEHTKLAARFISRRRPANCNDYTFLVPAPEERVIAATLQRMYRHLYIRLCDVCNTAGLIEARLLDYAELRAAAEECGIWPGVATYLKVVADYVERYRGESLELPANVLASARFGAEKMFLRGKYFWFPVLPQGLALYAQQFGHTAKSGDVPGIARLSLIPPLASVAALVYAVVGRSERIW